MSNTLSPAQECFFLRGRSHQRQAAPLQRVLCIPSQEEIGDVPVTEKRRTKLQRHPSPVYHTDRNSQAGHATLRNLDTDTYLRH